MKAVDDPIDRATHVRSVCDPSTIDQLTTCVRILAEPWDASKSTAQPPINCAHERHQWKPRRDRDGWPGGFVCCLCGGAEMNALDSPKPRLEA